MRGSRAITTLLLWAASCGFNPGGQADDIVDPDGGPEDDGSSGDAPCTERCEPGMLITCSGIQEVSTPCSAGCLDTGGPHCATLIPSNGAGASDLVDVTGDLSVAAGQIVVVDTDDGSIIGYIGGTPTTIRDPGNGLGDLIRFRAMSQINGAPAVAIFGVRSLSVADGGRLRIVGDRPVLFLVSTVATISGVVDAGAGHTGATGTTECQECSGPGGGDGATNLVAAGGCAPGLNGNYYAALHETGGGGGGFGFAGARGGNSEGGSAVGGDITPITGCTGASLVPLEGGAGGGRGSLSPAGFGAEVGGGGGGAIQLTALVGISITGTGEIYAGGAGGQGSVDAYGGAGGGAGGGILLEAPGITIASAARLTANGGGGGSGRAANRGENGSRGAVRASGGTGTGTSGDEGRGGLGGIGSGINQPATQGGGTIDGTGGGGGGAGIVRINTVTPLLLPSGVILSPIPSMGEPARQ